MLQEYLACGTNTTETIDFFSLNAYEWCGGSSFTQSGYAALNKNATGYNIPIFFSETGCNTNPPRDFADQASIFGSNMDDTWSGAIVYEWIQEANGYGLISYGSKVDASATDALDGYPRSGTPIPVSPDFSNLKTRWASLTPSGIPSSAYKPTNSPPACPSSTSNGWLVNGNVALPTVGQTAQRGAKQTGSPTGAGASATGTKKGSANGGKEITGMSVALVIVMFSFMYWL